MAEIGETLKNLSGIVSSVLVFVESKYPILPLNPKIREDSNYVAAIFAVIAGFGAHRFAKSSGRQIFGWAFLGLAFLDLVVIRWLVGTPPLSPHTTSMGGTLTYVLFFLFLGGAVGGFLRGDEQVNTADRAEPKS